MGTMIMAFREGPYRDWMVVMLATAVGVEPRSWPIRPAHMTAAS